MKIVDKKNLENINKINNEGIIKEYIVSDNSGRRFNIAITNYVLNIKNAFYVFPWMINEKRALEKYKELKYFMRF